MDNLIAQFIEKINVFDVEAALMLFASEAVIEDVSVGDAFVGIHGIRLYLETFFVGYKTTSKLLSLAHLDTFNAIARIDFTGDFGHEVGTLKVAINTDGYITRIDADLE